MFAFAFEERLFVFRLPNPAFAPLFALADKREPQAAKTFLFFQNVNITRFAVAPCPDYPLKTAQAEPNVRMRIRGAIIRTQITETRIRTMTRISRQKGTPGCQNPLFFKMSISHVLQSPRAPTIR